MKHLLVLALALLALPLAAAETRPPNIVLIYADDLGYGEVGCYGQKLIQTPCMDQLAKDGVRFTQFYTSAAVCAPARCSLMTGKHGGHATIRDNMEFDNKPISGQKPIAAADVTIAEVLKTRGYTTACIGKWGLGAPGNDGDPLKHGFDLFFGYYCQRHAHTHYPKFLFRNGKQVDLPGNDGKTGTQYSHDQFDTEALGFIRQNKDKPFFLYFAAALPHVSMQIPAADLAPYAGKFEETPYDGKKGYMAHPTPRAAYAAMISKFDASVGKVRALLEELKIADNTLIIVTSDNGATHDVGGVETKFFNSAAGLRGLKGSLFEGGIREPFIARWPGSIAPGRVVDEPAVAYDLFSTFCNVAGVEKAPATDGADLTGLLTGKAAKRPSDFLLWEFHGYGGQLALRLGEWKAVRQTLDNKPNSPVLLFNIAQDPSETTDVAAEHPDLVAKARALWQSQHIPNQLFTFPPLDPAKAN